MKKKRKQLIKGMGSTILLILMAFLVNLYNTQRDNEQETLTNLPNGTDIVNVHFIDVGQGDAILVESGDATMLIDAGENNKGDLVIDYLKSQNITKLDYVIGTHPHSDHIGGLDLVINAFKIHTLIMPDAMNTTKTFEDVIDAIETNNLQITKAKVGNQYDIGPASFTILAPNSSEYEELNNYSVVIKLTYGSNSFLLTGDAEALSEREMLENGYDLSADVLKTAHHGSAYSGTEEFLDEVNPTHAIISVGKDNGYGHPHTETLQSMLDYNISLYRTDIQGSVVFTSDGQNLSVNTKSYEVTDSDLNK